MNSPKERLRSSPNTKTKRHPTHKEVATCFARSMLHLYREPAMGATAPARAIEDIKALWKSSRTRRRAHVPGPTRCLGLATLVLLSGEVKQPRHAW